MIYTAKNFDGLLGTPGFSDTILKNHFTLYGGYVTNVNKLVELLSAKEPGTPEYSELQRRLGWEWNGMRLHELYFGNMKNGGFAFPDGELKQAIDKVYGGADKWRKNFTAVGAMRGIGWAILYRDPASGELFNAWVTEHDMGHLAGCDPLLVLDVFEHAYTLDYGIKKTDYIEAFMKAVDWDVVSRRFKE